MENTCVIGEADPFIARLLQRFAEESGLKTVYAKNGQELVVLVEQERPQLVIVDVELPGSMRGWQAIISLRKRSEFSRLPIITCSWLPAAEVRSLIGEAAGHLQKPDLHFKDFVAVLKVASIEGDQDNTWPRAGEVENGA